ncbi:SdpI family protein [Inconstantimicrobium mannanitabidum]|uniref:SdpI family protein n=1 Tax=Inconstantimicrobium mannanitabidum TaxID=1604901 RepID=UPI0035E40F98
MFLIIISLITPLALLIVGLVFHKHYPNEYKPFVGYRTTRAKKSKEAWNEANSYSTKLLIKYSSIILVITILTIVLVGKPCDIMGIISILSTLLGLIDIIIVYVLTEKHLKNMFGD